MTWRCPICGRPTDSTTEPDFPFCSDRCRLLDLGHWTAEDYRISKPLTDDSRESPPPAHDEPHSRS